MLSCGVHMAGLIQSDIKLHSEGFISTTIDLRLVPSSITDLVNDSM